MTTRSLRRQAFLALAVIPGLLLTACGSDRPEVSLKEAGSEPRQVLRFTLEEGYEETTTMTTRTNLSANGQDIEAPEIVMVQRNRVTNVSDDEFTVETEIISADAHADTPGDPAVEARLAAAVGLKTTIVFTERGEVTSSDVDIPSGTDEQTRQLLESLASQGEQLSVPLPEEEVGVGAEWTATTELENAGVTVDQTTTYTVVSIDGDQLEVRTTVEQEFSGDDVDSGSGSGTSTMTLSLSGVMPITASGSSSSSMRAQGNTIDTDTDIEISTEPSE